nr:hypothetical protein [Tanacetum cinerariifolium]
MSGDMACLDIAPVHEGRQKSCFLVVGSYNNTIRILSLDPHDCMQVLSVQSVTAAPESLLFLEVHLSVGRTVQTTRLASFLMLACKMGSSSVVDMVTGQLSDARSRLWLGYVHQGHFILTPLSYETLEYPASFSSDQCAEGVVVVVVGDALRVFTLERLGETFNETTIPLWVPSQLNCMKVQRKSVLKLLAKRKGKMEIETGGDDEDKEDPLSDEQYSYPKAEADKWVSCIRVL